LMARTASAKPWPIAPEGWGATADDRRADVRGRRESVGAGDALLTSAGRTATRASSVRSRMPRTRARMEASTRTPSARRLLRSGTAPTTSGAVVLTVRRMTRAELLELARRLLHEGDDLRIALTPSPGTEDVAGREDHRFRELHESRLAPSDRRLIDEMPALAAVSPATPPAAIKPVFSAFAEPGSSTLFQLDGSSVSLTVSSSRCSWLFLWKSRITCLTCWYATPSRSR
jgi:hypothetical protein